MAESLPLTSHQCQSYGIFWDIENCPIPARADVVVKNLKQFFTSKYASIVGQNAEPCVFVCACNAVNLDQMHIESLNRSGVDILHVNPTRPRLPNQNFKVVADDKLKECIQKFIEHHTNTKKSLIFVITGDVDFAPQIRTARRAGFQVILLYGAQTSVQIREAVDNAYSYYDVINGHFNPPIDVNLNLVSTSPTLGGPSKDLIDIDTIDLTDDTISDSQWEQNAISSRTNIESLGSILSANIPTNVTKVSTDFGFESFD